MMNLIFNIILILLSLSVSIYKFYAAFTAHDGMPAMLIRLTAGLVMAMLAWFLYKDRKMTRKERLLKWESVEKPRGIGVYLLKWVFGFGLIAGFLSFSELSELTEHTDLWVEGFIYITANMAGGLFIGVIGWRSNRNKVRALNLIGRGTAS
jgi:hypothetical protein